LRQDKPITDFSDLNPRNPCNPWLIRFKTWPRIFQSIPIRCFRTRLQFADLARLKGVDTAAVWEKSDTFIEEFEGAVNVRQVRETIQEITRPDLLQAHALLFRGREGAGIWRHASMKPLYRGQDCPDPQFVERSIDNFVTWLTAESVSEIHPIERAALVLTRIADIWPFQFGNLTVALIAANVCLRQAGPDAVLLWSGAREGIQQNCCSGDGHRNATAGQCHLQHC
jgi:hypothetical protein